VVVPIPSKIPVSDYIGVIKGKTAKILFKSYPGMKKKPIGGITFERGGSSSAPSELTKRRYSGICAIRKEKRSRRKWNKVYFALYRDAFIIEATASRGGSSLPW